MLDCFANDGWTEACSKGGIGDEVLGIREGG